MAVPETCAVLLAIALTAAAPAAWAASPFDGTYTGTGRLLSGTGCAGAVGAAFPVTLRVEDGNARMALRGSSRGLAGPVGADGSLQRLTWFGDSGVRDRSQGRIATDRFDFTYGYDWPSAGAAQCQYRYEGRRAP